MPIKVLIVEDDKNIADLLRIYLEKEQMECELAGDGLVGVEKFRQFQPDLVLLDIMLPGMDGWAVCRKIRETSKTPVIMLTAKGELEDKVSGLEMGADDYITKPFEALELLARIEAVLRRSGHQNRTFTLGNVEVDLGKHIVRRNGIPVELTAQEFSLLEVLIWHCNIALTREQLLEQAWEYDGSGETRTVDIHIQRLRKKLDWDQFIKTVYKYGYRLEKKI